MNDRNQGEAGLIAFVTAPLTLCPLRAGGMADAGIGCDAAWEVGGEAAIGADEVGAADDVGGSGAGVAESAGGGA